MIFQSGNADYDATFDDILLEVAVTLNTGFDGSSTTVDVTGWGGSLTVTLPVTSDEIVSEHTTEYDILQS